MMSSPELREDQVLETTLPSLASADATPAPLVEIDDVSFTYPTGTHALDRVTLAVPAGRIVGIVGPSGCGKSSLLAVLAGIRKPTSGRLVWHVDPGDKRHPISMVFQKDTLLPWLTVEGNVRLFYKLNRSRKNGADERVEELLKLAGLVDFRGAHPYQLSGGMRRRVAFIAAMAAVPRLLLLDEPFSSLDEPTRVAIHQDVLNIVRKTDTTVILVTHDLAEAVSLCDEVVILTSRPGRIATRHAIPFGRDRDVLPLRQNEEFLALYGRLWHDLSIQIERSLEQGTADEGLA
jgi:NitT/TauT family transport system ATP-binding protein